MTQAATSITQLSLPDEATTAALAGELAGLARSGDVFALGGALGVGKTFFARAFIRTLGGGAIEVPSPTFTLHQAYEFADVTVHHFDLFRLSGPGETLELGLEDAMAGGITLIEWPDRLGLLLPGDRLDLGLAYGDTPDSRSVTLTGHGAWAGRVEDIHA
jgi:tRNA threonylcarbamoyladenosine biosynthesis protein TsaE